MFSLFSYLSQKLVSYLLTTCFVFVFVVIEAMEENAGQEIIILKSIVNNPPILRFVALRKLCGTATKSQQIAVESFRVIIIMLSLNVLKKQATAVD